MTWRGRVICAALVALTTTASLASCTQSRMVEPIGNAEAPTDLSGGTPWSPGQFQYGVNLYWHTPSGAPDLAAQIERSIDYIDSLGANSVAVTFPLYVADVAASSVQAGPETPTPGDLARVLRSAEQRGMRTMVRPIIDEAALSAPHSQLVPSDPAAWFDSYGAVLAGYADAAQDAGSEEFVLGVGLDSLQNYTDEWRQLADSIGEVFTGSLSYSLNADADTAIPPVNNFGVNAYPSIDLSDDATTPQLTEALISWIQGLPAAVRDSLTIQEAAFPASAGMFGTPWDWSTGRPQNFVVQSQWFEAMITAAKQLRLRGVYVWGVDSSIDPAVADPTFDPPVSFIGRPAEDTIRTEFD